MTPSLTKEQNLDINGLKLFEILADKSRKVSGWNENIVELKKSKGSFLV